jgi:hypothetical protein
MFLVAALIISLSHSWIDHKLSPRDLNPNIFGTPSFPIDDKNKQEDIDRLVDSAETILNSELTGWVQQMQSAMAKIYE